MPETVVRFDDRRPIPAAILIGNENDNLVESVAFELADWLSEAVVYIYLTANGKSDVVNLGADRVFDITRTHTHEAGRWEAYLEAYLNGDRVWHSDEFAMYVGALPAIGKQIERQYPTAIEDALKAAETLTGLKARAETLPEGSEPTVRFDEEAGEIVYGLPLGPKGDAGFSPTIRTTAVSGGYEISITNPDGSMSVFMVTNGVSPTVRVSKIDGGNRVTITDASGPKTFDVMDGKDGNDVTGGGVEAALGYTPANAANVVQHTAQTLTEAQKTQARENIGAEKAAAKYELIETITCDGSYGNVSRTGLALKRAKIYIHTTAAAAAATIVAEINNGAGFFGYAWLGNAINTADRWTFINIVSDGDDAYVEFTAAAVQSYNAGAVQRTANRFDGKTPISRFNMYVAGGGMFPAGSTIEIWGVRA